MLNSIDTATLKQYRHISVKPFRHCYMKTVQAHIEPLLCKHRHCSAQKTLRKTRVRYGRSATATACTLRQVGYGYGVHATAGRLRLWCVRYGRSATDTGSVRIWYDVQRIQSPENMYICVVYT